MSDRFERGIYKHLKRLRETVKKAHKVIEKEKAAGESESGEKIRWITAEMNATARAANELAMTIMKYGSPIAITKAIPVTVVAKGEACSLDCRFIYSDINNNWRGNFCTLFKVYITRRDYECIRCDECQDMFPAWSDPVTPEEKGGK